MKMRCADMFFNLCYNCRESSHQWRDCPKPLRQGLQDLKEKVEKDKEWLNRSGGSREQGGHAPRKGQKGAGLAGLAKPQK